MYGNVGFCGQMSAFIFLSNCNTVNGSIEGTALGGLYTLSISIIEILSVFALIATFIFLARRNLLKIPRFHKSEMTGWPKLDGNIILYFEIYLVSNNLLVV